MSTSNAFRAEVAFVGIMDRLERAEGDEQLSAGLRTAAGAALAVLKAAYEDATADRRAA